MISVPTNKSLKNHSKVGYYKNATNQNRFTKPVTKISKANATFDTYIVELNFFMHLKWFTFSLLEIIIVYSDTPGHCTPITKCIHLKVFQMNRERYTFLGLRLGLQFRPFVYVYYVRCLCSRNALRGKLLAPLSRLGKQLQESKRILFQDICIFKIVFFEDSAISTFRMKQGCW